MALCHSCMRPMFGSACIQDVAESFVCSPTLAAAVSYILGVSFLFVIFLIFVSGEIASYIYTNITYRTTLCHALISPAFGVQAFRMWPNVSWALPHR